MVKKNKIARNSADAVVYARVSSKSQEENTSLGTQGDNCKEHAKKKGLKVLKEFGGVESAWGKVERKEFNSMIDFIKRHKNVAHIIFDFQDRMTRNFRDQLRIDELIDTLGITVHFARTNEIYGQGATADQKFMIGINSVVNKRLSDNISSRTGIGMSARAEQGWFPACAPIGYLNRDGVIVVDEGKAPLIKKAFELMASGDYSISMIADILYKDGIRSRKGKPICDGSLHKIFKNTIYYGPFLWGGKQYMGKQPPIITKELYERANKALSSNNCCIQKSTRNHPFNNLISCPYCNHRLVGDNKGGDFMYYRCSSKKARHAGQKIKYLTEKELLARAEILADNVSIPENVGKWMQKCLDRELSKLANTENKELTKRKKQLSAAQNRLQDLKDNAIAKGYAPEIVNYNLEQLKKEITEYTIEINTLETNINPEAIKAKSMDILTFVSTLGYTFKAADKHSKAALLKKIGERYAYDYDPETKEQKLMVIYREPFNFFAEGNKKREAFLGSPSENGTKISIPQIWGG